MSSKNFGKVLKLKSKDNKIFDVEESIAMQSKLIKTMVEDGGCTISVIPLFMVDSKTLTNVIEWCQKHVDYYVKQNNNDNDNVVVVDEEELDNWESKFVDVDTDSLYELFLAANYLDIQTLLNRVAKQVADTIKACKNIEEIRRTFGIKNDFTTEEDKEIYKMNTWNDI